mmetsp:Transcript_26540/g.62736  ORF Transcript_26540/g.62736 Transcript_26540/m.62736 type:complete len:281 (-) Transcript_26540:306-1148(-)
MSAKLPSTPGSPSTKRKRGSLNKPAALQIYQLRPMRSELDGEFIKITVPSSTLAKLHNVSEKTIRELWNRRCWTSVTRPLWSEAELLAESQSKAAAEASFSVAGNVIPAKTRARGRPRAHRESEASARVGFGDPFEEDWLRAVLRFDLKTMVDAADVHQPQSIFSFCLHDQPEEEGSWDEATGRDNAEDMELPSPTTFSPLTSLSCGCDVVPAVSAFDAGPHDPFSHVACASAAVDVGISDFHFPSDLPEPLWDLRHDDSFTSLVHTRHGDAVPGRCLSV